MWDSGNSGVGVAREASDGGGILERGVARIVSERAKGVARRVASVAIRFPRRPTCIGVCVSGLYTIAGTPSSLGSILFLVLEGLSCSKCVTLSAECHGRVYGLLKVGSKALHGELCSLSGVKVVTDYNNGRCRTGPGLFTHNR